MKPAINLPNLITLARIVLTPVMVIFVLDKKLDYAFAIFVIAGISDGLDGLLARILKQKTKTGAILDPIADKLLLNSAYATLVAIGDIPNYLAVLVISRDVIIIMGILLIFLFHKGIEIKPTLLGKTTTLFQLGTIFLVFTGHFVKLPSSILSASYILTAALTVLSGLHYMTLGISSIGNGDNPSA